MLEFFFNVKRILASNKLRNIIIKYKITSRNTKTYKFTVNKAHILLGSIQRMINTEESSDSIKDKSSQHHLMKDKAWAS
jgi:hypothetical protein